MSRSALLPALAVAAALAPGARGRTGGTPAGGGPVVNSLAMRMVLLPAGAFEMGSPPGAPSRQEEEAPHRVVLTKAFRISATEVTRRQWLALMPLGAGPQPDDDAPAASVSWREAEEFCARLSRREKATYRLPKESRLTTPEAHLINGSA